VKVRLSLAAGGGWFGATTDIYACSHRQCAGSRTQRFFVDVLVDADDDFSMRLDVPLPLRVSNATTPAYGFA
jgi:hypothetical protein